MINPALLGTIPDADLALEAGVPVSTIIGARARRGIPAHPDDKAGSRSVQVTLKLTKAEADLLHAEALRVGAVFGAAHAAWLRSRLLSGLGTAG